MKAVHGRVCLGLFLVIDCHAPHVLSPIHIHLDWARVSNYLSPIRSVGRHRVNYHHQRNMKKFSSYFDDVLLLMRRTTLKCLGENWRAPPGKMDISVMNGDKCKVNCTSSCCKAQLMPILDASPPNPVKRLRIKN